MSADEIDPAAHRILEMIHRRDRVHRAASSRLLANLLNLPRPEVELELRRLKDADYIYRDLHQRSAFHITQAGGDVIGVRVS